MQAGFNYWRSMCWVQRTAFSASCSELWPWLVWWFYYTCNHIFKLAILSGKWMFWQLTIFSSFAVYCESCMSAQVNVPLKCQVCHCTHTGDFPKVCLDLDHFLEEQFPKEYSARHENVHNRTSQSERGDSSFCKFYLHLFLFEVLFSLNR